MTLPWANAGLDGITATASVATSAPTAAAANSRKRVLILMRADAPHRERPRWRGQNQRGTGGSCPQPPPGAQLRQVPLPCQSELTNVNRTKPPLTQIPSTRQGRRGAVRCRLWTGGE